MTKQKRQNPDEHRFTLRTYKSLFLNIVDMAKDRKRSASKEIELAMEEHVRKHKPRRAPEADEDRRREAYY